MLKQNIEKVLREYLVARRRPFSPNNVMVALLEDTIPGDLQKIASNPGRFVFKGSAGSGFWATCPWVAVFDPRITHSVQAGYFPVYVFRGDMKGLYLALILGVMKKEEKLGERAITELRMQVSNFRTKLNPLPDRFKETSINLHSTSTSPLPALYEAATICAKYYGHETFPSEEILESDLKEILKLYERLIAAIGRI